MQQNVKLEKNIPIKETFSYLTKFKQFSMLEKINTEFYRTSSQASLKVAEMIRDAIKLKNNSGKNFVLGLATGSTPLKIYKELIIMYQKGEISFKNVITFNLDEYYPITKDNIQSYNYYMNKHLFNHIDCPKQNINIPNGEILKEKVAQFCKDYEKKIQDCGGIDLQLLGIGRTGHIGFNQPPSPINSITRLVYLHRLTRKDAAGSFGGIQKVPKCAITMGISTIKKARKIIIVAFSQSKANIVKKSIEGPQTNQIPSTFLHTHPSSIFFLDKAAGQMLTRFNTPWIIKGDYEDPEVPKSVYWILKSINWLCQKVNKSILRLAYEDYQDNNLANLIIDCAQGKTEDLNLFAYKTITNKITGWPLGRPTNNTEIKKQRVLIFSPHPDDDVISMGGTIRKLYEQGHQIHIAYMTSGSNAVFDYQARKYMLFMDSLMTQYFEQYLTNAEKTSVQFCEKYKNFTDEFQNYLNSKSDGMKSKSTKVSDIKRFIRESQARIALDSLGLKDYHIYCLNLPFYGSHLNKNPISNADYDAISTLVKKIQPTTIFAAGDLTDPHGTHRKCLEIILKVYEDDIKLQNHQKIFPPSEKILLYRGAWEEWSIEMSRIIVPMSPKDVSRKLSAILKHQSQKDSPMFPGDDKRQFWQRVQQRNRQTARQLRNLGFTQYQAAECFVNLDDLKNYDQI